MRRKGPSHLSRSSAALEALGRRSGGEGETGNLSRRSGRNPPAQSSREPDRRRLRSPRDSPGPARGSNREEVPLFSLTRAVHPTPAEQNCAGLVSRRRHGSPRLRLSDRRLPQREIALGRRSGRSFTAQASLAGMRSLGCEPGNRFSTEFQPRCLFCSTRSSCDGWGRSIEERSAKTRDG